jgi:lysozyme
MTHSFTCTSLVASSEGCKLTAYLDGNNIPTIGFGHTGKDVHIGLTITLSEATAFLNQDLSMTDVAVTRLVRVGLNQNQFDALVSFVFNIGQGHFNSSTCLKMLNAGKYLEAASHILDWNKVAGKVSSGLMTRRLKERVLFLSAT